MSEVYFENEIVEVEGDTALIEFWYPSLEKSAKYIEVGLMATRAADSIRIHYDLDRDGYVIEQASRFVWKVDEECDSDWQEVAFVEAWAREDIERKKMICGDD